MAIARHVVGRRVGFPSRVRGSRRARPTRDARPMSAAVTARSSTDPERVVRLPPGVRDRSKANEDRHANVRHQRTPDVIEQHWPSRVRSRTPGMRRSVSRVPSRPRLNGSWTARGHTFPKLIRVVLALVALSTALVVMALPAGYFVYYHRKLGPAQTDAELRTDAMRSVHCVRGWQRLSTWTYVCTIQWRDGRRVTG